MNLFLNHFRDDLERLNGDLHKYTIRFAEASGSSGGGKMRTVVFSIMMAIFKFSTDIKNCIYDFSS